MAKAAPKQEPDVEIEQDEPLILLASETMRGDVRDSILAWFKAQPKPWSGMSESEQRNLAGAIDSFSAQLVRSIAEIIAAKERPCIVASLVEYKEKDGLEAKLKLASKDTNVVELHRACGKEVLIVTSGAEDFLGEGGEAEIDADQPVFPALDAASDEIDFPETV